MNIRDGGAKAPKDMKILILLAATALAAACGGPPEKAGQPPAGMRHPWTGVAVEEIRQPVTLDASISITRHISYDRNWDAILNGDIDPAVGQPHGVDPARQLICPQMWVSVWRQDDPSVVYTWFYAPSTGRAIARPSIPPSSFVPGLTTTGCDYRFRNGGTSTTTPPIPVGHGNLYVAVYPVCPNDISRGYGGVHAFDPIVVTVNPGESKAVAMSDLNGPAFAKTTWQSVAYQCGMSGGADPRWTSPTTLSYQWCEKDPLGGGGCLPGSTQRFEFTW